MIRLAVAIASIAITPLTLALPVQAKVLPLIETARIGGGDEDPDYLFGRISFVTAGPDECVIVADQQIRRIRKYSVDGEYLADIGREGGGPGEYYEVQGMVVLPNGTLAVLSNPAQVSIFDAATGEYRSAFLAHSSYHGPDMITYDDDGFLYVKAVGEILDPQDDWPLEWRKLSPEGEALAEIAIPAWDLDPEPVIQMSPYGMRMSFPTATESAWSPRGYLVVGRNDRYEIELRRPEGTLTIRWEFEPVRLTPGEREEWEAVASRMERNTGESYQIPKEKPSFRGLSVDPFGRIWVQLYAPAEEVSEVDGDGDEYTTWREPNRYDVFDESAQYLGAVYLPLGAQAVAWGEHSLWGVQESPTGQQLVRWEIEGL
jgi:hypothetical protein